MPKIINYQLSEEEAQIIAHAIQHDPRGEVVRRATAVQMLHLGIGMETVTQVLGVADNAVYEWHERWREEGLEGLANRPKSGRPRKTSEAYWQVVEKALDTDPEEYGYLFSIWTLDTLRDHLVEETGIHISVERLRVQMKERGYVWRRPKHELSSLQNKEAREDAWAVLDELKKEPRPEPLSFSLWTKVP
jgi:putative transposase